MPPRRPFARFALITGLAGLPILAIPDMAGAQIVPGFPPQHAPTIDQQSLDRMGAAAARLYEGRSIGTVERWRNPDTGDAGSVKLMAKPVLKGMPCRRIAYTTRPENADRPQAHYTLTWCKTASGEWKIVDDVHHK